MSYLRDIYEKESLTQEVRTVGQRMNVRHPYNSRGASNGGKGKDAGYEKFSSYVHLQIPHDEEGQDSECVVGERIQCAESISDTYSWSLRNASFRSWMVIPEFIHCEC